jgi:hypothetical protein
MGYRDPFGRAFSWFCAVAVFLGLVAAASGQFSIVWHTIDGGGGTSAGGGFSVSGTIGQPDAGGPMTSGTFAVTGGFWALPTAIQSEGAPVLRIVPTAPGQASIYVGEKYQGT